jgi:hypothetical protein
MEQFLYQEGMAKLGRTESIIDEAFAEAIYSSYLQTTYGPLSPSPFQKPLLERIITLSQPNF